MYAENVKFYLKNKNSEKETPIYARIRIQDKKFKYGIRKSIYPDLWDFESQRPTKDKVLLREWQQHTPQIRTHLENIATRQQNIADLITGYVNSQDQIGERYSHKDLRDFLDKRLDIVREKDDLNESSVLHYYDKFIEGMQNGKVLQPNKNRYSEGTIRTYIVTRNKLEEYQRKRRVLLSFDDITMDFYYDFVQFFYDQDMSHNTIGNNIKHLKVIMQSAQYEGLHSNEMYRDKRFKVLEAPAFTIYLSKDEIDKIKALDLSVSPKLELTRDIFLVCYYTAARISDAYRIDKNSFYQEDGQSYVEILVKKSNNESRVKVPVKKDLELILAKYDYRLPFYSEQKVNQNLKVIGEMAGLDEIVKKVEKRGGRSVTKEMSKYELITTHTARRSAATNMFKFGIPTILIMKLTGHKTEKSFLKYIRLDANEAAQLLANHEFFK